MSTRLILRDIVSNNVRFGSGYKTKSVALALQMLKVVTLAIERVVKSSLCDGSILTPLNNTDTLHNIGQ